MPWQVMERNNKYCVVAEGDGKTVACHDTRAEALAQLRALYANEPEAAKGTLSVFKQADGRWRWVGITSTAYRDRDGEIVSTKALEDDVARADAEGNYGPLRWWHIKGADFGDCDFNMMHGPLLLESGTFRDERDGARIAARAKEYRWSIGFNHPPDQPDTDGVFHTIRRFERSLLPKGAESNLFTRLVVTKEQSTMGLKEKIEELHALLGADRAKEVLAQADVTQKEAEALGVAFKEATEEAPIDTPPPPVVEEAAPTPTPDITALVKAEVEAAFASFSQTVKEAAAKEEEERTKAATRLTALEADLTTTKAALTQTQAALKEAAAKIAELEGETPRAAKGFRASASDDTLLGDDSRLKGLVPQPDPRDEVLAKLFPGMAR